MGPEALSIWSSAPNARRELNINGRFARLRAAELRTLIESQIGRDSSNLFAEPSVTGSGTVVWTDTLGATDTRALQELPPAERAVAEARLKELLSRIEPLQGDPKLGALVSAALVLESADAIRVASGRPILAGWGALPAGVHSAEDMRSHQARTLGPYLGMTDPPVPGTTTVSAGVIEPARRGWWYGSRAPLIALALAAAVLLFLLLPGVLGRLLPQAIQSADLRCVQRDNEALNALERQVHLREQQLGQDACALDRRDPPRIERQPRASNGGQADPRTPPLPSPPVRPDQSPVPPEASPSNSERPETLAKLLNAATVLIVTNHGVGSGFFVSPQMILTNRHVVENADGVILAGNKKLGQLRRVDKVAVTASSQPGEPDYALLKLQNGRSSVFLSIASELPEQLQNVVAAGFPQIVIESDANFPRLQAGDASALPDMALTSGTVVVVQNSDSPSPVILHRASISPGNSGGPLVDECGRVVGVNTYVAAQSGAADRMNYSLGTPSAAKFVRDNGAGATFVAGRCVVGSQQPSPQPATPQAEASPRAGEAAPPAAPSDSAQASTPPALGSPPPRQPDTHPDSSSSVKPSLH